MEKMRGTYDAKQVEAKRKLRDGAKKEKENDVKQDEASNKKAKADPAAAAAVVVPVIPQAPQEPPNRILFVQNLPEESTELMVTVLFQQFPNFESVRLVEGQGIAFVTFGDIASAEVAMKSLQHFKIKENHLMMISFAKQ